jgi:sec-independent protein translocase protein TatB
VFDLGLSKLAVIGVVALVVIGPERLPKVARTVGTLLGRAQRYLADVKAEVNREMQLDELKAMRDTVQSAASSFQASVHDNLRQTEADLNSAFESSSIESPHHALMTPIAAGAVAPAKRKQWRRNVVRRQSGMPLWFKSASRKRTRVQSAAARVARYRVR